MTTRARDHTWHDMLLHRLHDSSLQPRPSERTKLPGNTCEWRVGLERWMRLRSLESVLTWHSFLKFNKWPSEHNKKSALYFDTGKSKNENSEISRVYYGLNSFSRPGTGVADRYQLIKHSTETRLYTGKPDQKNHQHYKHLWTLVKISHPVADHPDNCWLGPSGQFIQHQ